MRERQILTVLALVAAGIAIPITARATTSTQTFTTIADAYVSEAAPTTAKGATDSTNCLVNDDSPNRHRCLVSFTVSGLSPDQRVTAAQLRIVDKGDSTGSKLVNVSPVSAFDESTVAWGNMGTVGAVVGSQTAHAFGQDSVFNLSAGTVAGNGSYAFALWSPPSSYSTGMNFQTKENTVGRLPARLVLTVSTGSAPVAALTVGPVSGKVPLKVTADASKSTDPDNDISSYTFDWGDGARTSAQTNAIATHTYTSIGSFTVTVTVADTGGRSSTATARVGILPRFPGDPGPGRVHLGLNDVNGADTVEAAVGHLALRRIYNNGNWGIPLTNLKSEIAKGHIPWVSWGFSPYTVSTVPQSAVDQICADLKSVAPAKIWAVSSLHEPEDNVSQGTQAAAFRALQRNIVQTCRSIGVTNVAWTEPTYMRFTFVPASGRDFRQWNGDWKGTDTKTSADFYTGANSIYDITAEDVYVPLIGSTTWRTVGQQIQDMLSVMQADGYQWHPLAIAELGIKSDPNDLTVGPTQMQNAYSTAMTSGLVGMSYWTTGGDSFCDGPAPSSDPQCRRENELIAQHNDQRTDNVGN